MSAFGELSIGTSVIHAVQRGLDVTGQKIANAATPGYTRQRVDLESVGGPGVSAFWSRYDGTGQDERKKTMTAVERIVAEPSETGLQPKLPGFSNSFSQVGDDPKGIEPKNPACENASIVADQRNHMNNAVTTHWRDTRAKGDANVTAVTISPRTSRESARRSATRTSPRCRPSNLSTMRRQDRQACGTHGRHRPAGRSRS